MCHLRHMLRIFSFRRKVMFHSQDISFFNHHMFYQICDVMMSLNTWNRLHFLIHLLNQNSLSHQTWPIDRYKQGTNFFLTIWRTGAKFKVLFNLAACFSYSVPYLYKFLRVVIFALSRQKIHLREKISTEVTLKKPMRKI